MKKLTLAIILSFLLALAGCGGDSGTVANEPTAEPTSPTSPAPSTSSASGGAVAEIQEGQEGSESAAYFAVIKKLATMWQGAYMGLDMTNIEVDDSDLLIEMVRNYCANHSMTLLLDDMDGLMEKGYIESDGDMAIGFTDGYLIEFASSKLTKKKLTAEASCWYGNLGSEGGTFTVKKKDGAWVLDDEVKEMWIS